MSNKLYGIILGAGFLLMIGLYVDGATQGSRLAAKARHEGLAAVALNIREIECTACRASIRDDLLKTPGVDELAVDHDGMVVAYEPKRTTPAALVAVVDDAGYHASVRPGAP